MTRILGDLCSIDKGTTCSSPGLHLQCILARLFELYVKQVASIESTCRSARSSNMRGPRLLLVICIPDLSLLQH